MTRQELFDGITEAVKEILTTGNNAPRAGLRPCNAPPWDTGRPGPKPGRRGEDQ